MTEIAETRTETAPDEAAGERLDRWMAAIWSDLSRSRCKALVEAGRLFLDDAPLTDPSAKVRAGGVYRLDVPVPETATPKPEAIPLDVLYEDDQLIVVNKAAGMTVHPAAGAWTGTLVHALLHHCAGSLSGIGGVERPGIVHRLDKDTSGVMVVAKTDAAHQSLQKQFADHTVERAYLAFVRGAPIPRAGRLETRLARSSHDRKKFAVVRDPDSTAGKIAVTNYRTLATYGQEPRAAIGAPMAALVECRLETGRTHQIRVHMAHLGCPILGDPLYGRGRSTPLATAENGKVFRDFRRQALHAAVLGFDHPATGERLRFETETPKDMQRLQGFLERL
ncbi:RluA family pseudouridine synthase [Marinicauda salina]|uniref:Pseudouridine synthase n=1 Tax=Marinicauda salina TaxID=2135793 RepID=A0A2U2BXB4_9PROT|nr:RluA family pseudouridine synthase [Marinicauda salina]PWE18637.1 RluA family pseudouridine synthase [Marinicauda salina]